MHKSNGAHYCMYISSPKDLLVQTSPFPVYPTLQEQSKLPIVSEQLALGSHGVPNSHSLISAS